MVCTQKQYPILLDGVTQMDESTWSNEAQRCKGGQFAVVVADVDGMRMCLWTAASNGPIGR
jgi:hypothetical protein